MITYVTCHGYVLYGFGGNGQYEKLLISQI